MKLDFKIWILVFTVFLNLSGFGLILPLFPLYADSLGGSPEAITITMAAYSVGQVFTAPFWGRLSDAIGRKKVMVVTLFGFGVAYVVLGFAQSMIALFAARCFAGLFAGNISTAYAAASDMTEGPERSKVMGLLGAAFGIGLIAGPAIASVIAILSPENAFLYTSITAGVASFIAMFATYFFLPETLKEENRKPFGSWKPQFKKPNFDLLTKRPVLGALIGANLIALTSIGLVTSIMALWAAKRLNFDATDVGIMYIAIGAISAVVQGGAIGPMVKKFGDWNVALIGYAAMGLGLLVMTVASTVTLMWVGLFGMAFGSSASNPPLTSLASQEATASEGGVVMGLFQSSGSLGRVMGPLMSGVLFAQVGFSAPYLVGAVLMIPVMLLLVWARRQSEAVA